MTVVQNSGVRRQIALSDAVGKELTGHAYPNARGCGYYFLLFFGDVFVAHEMTADGDFIELEDTLTWRDLANEHHPTAAHWTSSEP